MPFEHISCEQLRNQLENPEASFTLVDIRDLQSFNAGHIEGAIHIDNSSVSDFLMQANKAIPLIVYCYHGNSSQSAADYFNSQGFGKTYSLDGGYDIWKSRILD